MIDKLLGAVFRRPAGPASPPARERDAMDRMLDKMQRDLAAAEPLDRAAHMERIIRSQSALIIDLRNRVRDLERTAAFAAARQPSSRGDVEG